MTVIIALHGFLGEGADYSFLKLLIDQQFTKSTVKLWAPNLFEPNGSWAPSGTMQDWALAFNDYIENTFAGDSKILIGYSLGGRLAMQALLAKPELWQASLLVSSNLLPLSPVEIESREYWDQKWAAKFRYDNWNKIVQEWHSLTVFRTSKYPAPARHEMNFDRDGLAAALELWSPVRQSELSKNQLNQLSNCHFVVGLKDRKYVAIQQRIAEISPNIHMWQIEGGHRLLIDRKEWISKKLTSLVLDVIKNNGSV